MGAYSDRDAILRAMGYADYPAYLASPLWKSIRHRALRRDRGACRACGAKTSIVHHDSYDLPTLRGNTIESLFALCNKHHQAVEFDGDRKRSFAEVRACLERLLKVASTKRRAKPAKAKAKAKKKPVDAAELRAKGEILLEERRRFMLDPHHRCVPSHLKLRHIERLLGRRVDEDRPPVAEPMPMRERKRIALPPLVPPTFRLPSMIRGQELN